MNDYIQIRINKNTLDIFFWIVLIGTALFMIVFSYYQTYHIGEKQGIKEGYDNGIYDVINWSHEQDYIDFTSPKEKVRLYTYNGCPIKEYGNGLMQWGTNPLAIYGNDTMVFHR